MRRTALLLGLCSVALGGACGGNATLPASPPPPPTVVPVVSIDAGPPDGAVASTEPTYLSLLREIQAPSAFAPDRIDATKRAFAALRQLSDPRAADALNDILSRKPPPSPRWRTQAALALGELGDVRPLIDLAWRIEQDPLKLYDATTDADLRRDDNERVVAARVLVDLLSLNQGRYMFSSNMEGAVLTWLDGSAIPHAHGMRALAFMRSTKGRARLRAWAEPKIPLPKEGAQEFPQEFAIAQTALRSLGLSIHGQGAPDPDTWQLLQKQLFRKPANVDLTMEALLQGGRAVLGMTHRALAIGAAQGFAEIGDPRAGPLLVRFVEDPTQNEQARIEACRALTWTMDERFTHDLAKKVASRPGPLPPKDELVRRCFLDTLAHVNDPSATSWLLPLFSKSTPEDVRALAGVTVGMNGVYPVMASLRARMDDSELRAGVALAFILGAHESDIARTACKKLETATAAEQEAIALHVERAFSTIYEEDLSGGLERRSTNVVACGGQLLDAARRGLRSVGLDTGPRSVTRMILRARLVEWAKASPSTIEVLGDEAITAVTKQSR